MPAVVEIRRVCALDLHCASAPAYDPEHRFADLESGRLHGRGRAARLQQQSAAATDLLNVVVSVYDRLRCLTTALSGHGSGSLQAWGYGGSSPVGSTLVTANLILLQPERDQSGYSSGSRLDP